MTAGTEKPLEMMARIAEKYQLSFPKLESIRNTSYKHLFKNVLVKNDIPTAKSYLFKPGISKNVIPGLAYPLIVKPVDNSGSRGVIYCKNKKELSAGIKLALLYSKTKMALAEEYIEGKEYSVESLISRKRVTIISITEKLVTPHPYNVELGHIQPARLSKITHQKIINTITKLVSSVELDNCACHTELKFFRGIPYIIENGARLGGDYITSDLIPLSTGVNMEQEVIKIALGKAYVYSKAKTNSSYIKYFNFGEGTIKYDENSLKKIKHKNLVKIKLFLKSGQNIPQIRNSLDRYGFIIVKGDDRSSVILAMNKIYKEVLNKIQIIHPHELFMNAI